VSLTSWLLLFSEDGGLMPLRILLADDHKIMRDGLRVLLEKQPDIQVAGEADNGRMAVRMARELPADMVIMDIGMPDLNGIDATREIVASVPGVKVIALSMHSDKVFVGEMFRAGASAYLLKHCAFEELAQAIQVVRSGQFYLSPQIAGLMIKDYVRQMSNDNTSVFGVLTVREREVLQLLAEGKSSRQIASHLHISLKTVETRRQQIMAKLNTDNMADLIKHAIRDGLTSLDPSRS
jgi:two-component system, NarL family, response regulator NreC